MNHKSCRLLADDEPTPVTVRNEDGQSPFLIVVDHAGNLMPRTLGRLGVAEAECERHIAWDLGVGAVSRLLADALDATLVQQNYSRLSSTVTVRQGRRRRSLKSVSLLPSRETSA